MVGLGCMLGMKNVIKALFIVVDKGVIVEMMMILVLAPNYHPRQMTTPTPTVAPTPTPTTIITIPQTPNPIYIYIYKYL